MSERARAHLPLSSTKGAINFNVARNIVTYQPDRVDISISPATEADLIDAQRAVAKNGSGADQVAIREFLRAVRNEPARPLEITVVNAKDIGSVAKVLTVTRDDTGNLTGAVSQPIS